MYLEAQPNKLIVLCNYLTRTCKNSQRNILRKLLVATNQIASSIILAFREVESECRLICSKIVNMENELFGQIVLPPPDDPTDTCVDEPVFVAADINALD